MKTGPFGTLLKASEYSEIDGVPVISVGEVREGYFRLTEHTPLVPESVQRRLSQYLLKAGDVVFGRKGAVDRSALVRQPQAGWFLGSDGIAVRPSAEHCPEYVAAQFQSFKVRQWLASNSTGTTMASMNQGVLSRVAIPFPPTIAEERSIAEVLNDADALIDSLEQLLTKKRQVKQGAMQELLTGKRRLPGFQQSWSEVRLGSVGRTYGGLTGKGKADFGHGASKYITFMNVMTTVRTSTEMVESVEVGPSESQNMVQPGDLLFNGSSETPEEVALCSWVESCDEGVFLNSFCFGFRPFDSDRLSGLFMAYFFRGRPGRAAVSSLAQGATRYNIAKTALLQAPLCLPAFAEQQAIAEVLSSMDTEIAALESRLTKARALKQAMAQALLTGRIRIPLGPQEPAVPVPPPEGVGALRSGPARAQEPSA